MLNEARTLEPDTLVSCGVLNSWARFLNMREHLKAPETYSRFYFSTYPVLSTVVEPQKSWTAKKAFEVFADRVDNELIRFEGSNIEQTDLVFFPIWQEEHYYVIVFNFRAKNVVIIDNLNALDDQPMSTKYKNIPQRLFKFFMAYLKSRIMQSKIKDMALQSIDRMRMHWQNITNKKDCTVYTMRHMEVYKGEKVNWWKIGLPKDKDHTHHLQYLRARYATVLLTAECNSRAGQNGVAVGMHYERENQNGGGGGAQRRRYARQLC